MATIILASIAGLCGCVSSNIVSWHSFQQSKGIHLKRCDVAAPVLNIVFGLGAVGFFVLSTGYGAVSLAMPITAGVTLLLNMITQTQLGISRYNKNMMTGTLVLVIAIVCLVDVGPEAQEDEDIMDLLTAPLALVCTGALVGLLVLAGVLVKGVMKLGPDSIFKISILAIFSATANVLGASLGKALTSTSGWVFPIFLILYLLTGVFNFGADGVAAGSVDMTLYLPLNSCLKLLINMGVGIMVWEDGKGIDSWAAYICVYMLIVLGVYSCSSLDVVTAVAMRSRIKRTMLSQGVVVSQFGRAVRDVLLAWKVPNMTSLEISVQSETNSKTNNLDKPLLTITSQPNERPNASTSLPNEREAFVKMLEKGLSLDRISPAEILQLLVMVLDSPQSIGTAPNPVLFKWLESHCEIWAQYSRHDPEMRLGVARVCGVRLAGDDDDKATQDIVGTGGHIQAV